jgi:hypothetical protein
VVDPEKNVGHGPFLREADEETDFISFRQASEKKIFDYSPNCSNYSGSDQVSVVILRDPQHNL